MDAEALNQCQVRGDAEPGLYVLLEVTDDGPGMDPKTAARIFEPFFGARPPSRGLGLAATAAIIRRHHGAIWVSTQSGEGTCMRLLFPVARRTPRAEAATPAATTSEAAFPEAAMPVPVPMPVPSEPMPSVRGRVVSDLARLLRSLPLSFGKKCPKCGGAGARIKGCVKERRRILRGTRVSERGAQSHKEVLMRWWLMVPVLLSLAAPSKAQSPSEVPILAGVDSVEAQILLSWDEEIPNISENTIKSRLQAVCEMELGRNLIIVTEGADNLLNIVLVVSLNDGGLVAYRWDIYLLTLDGALVMTSWLGEGGVGTVGRNDVQESLEQKVRELAQNFVTEYRAARR